MTMAQPNPAPTPQGAEGPRFPSPEFTAKVALNARASMRLALPAMASRAGILLMLSVDTIMVGHTGQDQLAFLIVAASLQSILMLIAIGFLQGTMVLVSQAFGAREYDFCGEVWRVALIIAAVLGTLGLAFSFFGEPLYLWMGQSAGLSAGGGAVLTQYGWGIPAMMLYIACSYFLEGIQRPRVGMVIMLTAIFVNAGLNALALYVWDGGAVGAVAMTSVTRWIAFFVIFAYIAFVMADRAEFGVRLPGAPTKESALAVWRYVKRALNLGWPMGITQGAETAGFATLTLTAALMGEASAAAHGVTMQIVQIVFMMAIGMSAATSVRAGFAVGSGNPKDVAWVGWTGAGLIVLIMMPFGIMFAAFPRGSAMIFTTAPETLAIAQVTIRIAALMLIFDSLMTVMIGALRGAGDVIFPMVLHVIAMWIIMVPLAWFLGRGLDWGVPGLFMGIVTGIMVAAGAQVTRFAIVSRRDIVRA